MKRAQTYQRHTFLVSVTYGSSTSLMSRSLTLLIVVSLSLSLLSVGPAVDDRLAGVLGRQTLFGLSGLIATFCILAKRLVADTQLSTGSLHRIDSIGCQVTSLIFIFAYYDTAVLKFDIQVTSYIAGTASHFIATKLFAKTINISITSYPLMGNHQMVLNGAL